MKRHVVTAVLGLTALAACGGQGYETVVENHSPISYVVEVEDGDETRYYALPLGASLVVDDVAHQNAAAEKIMLLDRDCLAKTPIAGSFLTGGLITIGEDGVTSFEPGREKAQLPRFLMGPDEYSMKRSTCEAAVQDL